MIKLGQFLDVFLAAALISLLIKLDLRRKYRAFLIFVAYDSLESLIYLFYISINGRKFLDYRALWCAMQLLSWVTTIWMVYSLLTAILKGLPGIRRFSISFLNAVFSIAVILSVLSLKYELDTAKWVHNPSALLRLTAFFHLLSRGLSLAELVALLSTLIFILFFPIRVPRNLAVFAVGLSIYLLLAISLLLIRSYEPSWQYSLLSQAAPSFVSAACLIYWLLCINVAGEQTDATLGRNWAAIPQTHLVRQLEALNAALLRSREQS